jgi:predicted GNAT family N-acyltransferase
MIEAVMLSSKEAVQEIFDIRDDVFTREQGMDPKVQKDAYDNFAHYVYVTVDGKPAGTGRIIYKDDEYLIGRIAVLKEFRGQQLGDLIVRMLVDYGFKLGAETVHVHSLLYAVGFYEKVGFSLNGDAFIEAGLEHVDMTIGKNGLKRHCCE